jgi:hypothetical protein
LEAFAEEQGEIVRQQPSELVCLRERPVRDRAFGFDSLHHRGEARVAGGGGSLDVEQPRLLRREAVLLLQSRNGPAGRDPAVALAVDADEHVALVEVGGVELARRVRTCAELEHDGRQPKPLDRVSRCRAFVRELLERRADEHPQALVRCRDHRSSLTRKL